MSNINDELDEILTALINTGLAFGRNPQLQSTVGGEPVNEAKQAILNLITEARTDELMRLKKIDCFNEAYTTDVRPARLVDIRIKELEGDK